MKKTLIIVLALVLAVGCVFAFTACNGIKDSTPAGIQKYGKLVVATNAYFPPFEYHDSTTGEITGWDMDIAAELAKKLGVELVIEDMEFDAIINAVTSGKADFGAAGMTVTEDRLLSVDFSTPYTTATQVIVVRK